jgi:hypothetical protein
VHRITANLARAFNPRLFFHIMSIIPILCADINLGFDVYLALGYGDLVDLYISANSPVGAISIVYLATSVSSFLIICIGECSSSLPSCSHVSTLAPLVSSRPASLHPHVQHTRRQWHHLASLMPWTHQASRSLPAPCAVWIETATRAKKLGNAGSGCRRWSRILLGLASALLAVISAVAFNTRLVWLLGVAILVYGYAVAVLFCWGASKISGENKCSPVVCARECVRPFRRKRPVPNLQLMNANPLYEGNLELRSTESDAPVSIRLTSSPVGERISKEIVLLAKQMTTVIIVTTLILIAYQTLIHFPATAIGVISKTLFQVRHRGIRRA